MSDRFSFARIIPLLFVVLAASALSSGQTQEQQVKYTQSEYNAYNAAVSAEPDARGAAIVDFIKNHPQSQLISYTVGPYVQLMQERINAGQTEEAFKMGEQMLAVRSDEVNVLYLTAYSGSQLRNFTAAIRYGEKFYEVSRSGGVPEEMDLRLAFVMATAYRELKNEDKFIQYAEKSCAGFAAKDCYDFLAGLAQIHAGRKEWSKATGYARQATEGVEAAARPAHLSERDWNRYVRDTKARNFAVMGQAAVQGEDWNRVASNYRQVIRLAGDRPLKAEGYYYVGMANWRQQNSDAAMEAFAWGSILRGAPHAGQCRNYLELLYRSTHNDSLAGIEDFVDRVTRGN